MIKLIAQLKSIYNIKSIENAMIQYFIERNDISVKKNILIRSILNRNNKKIRTIKGIIAESLDILDIYDLVRVFEQLIPNRDKKINGAFFTPRSITKFIVNNVIKSENQSICDPSCGCGAFLIEAAVFLNKKYNKRFNKIFSENLFGVDIADYSIRRSKILLSLLAISDNEDKREYDFNIYQRDSLKVNWNKLFPDVFKKGGFDVIIGNPPYVRFQDLSNVLRRDLYDNWQTLKKGNYNLYFAFFELGVKIMQQRGILGYITPNNYFTSIAGINLRKFLNQDKLISKILDFNHLRLFDVQTYTCVTFLSKMDERSSFDYEKIENAEDLKRLGRIKYSKVRFANLIDKKWRLLKSIDQENVKKIENAGKRLGELTDVRVGFATCKDSIYFIDSSNFKNNYYQKKYKNRIYLIEPQITLPVVKISDFRDQKELSNNKRRIIFPYVKENGGVKIIHKEELKSKFPQCYKYLLAAKRELLQRDKGKVRYSEWYAYARSQGLNFYGEKLLTPTFSSRPRFLYEKNPNTLFCNGYAVYLKKEQDLFLGSLSLDVLSKILNSKVMSYYIDKTSVSIEGGYPCYQKNFIELFNVPMLTVEELNYLDKEKDKKNIDNFLTKKYKLKF